MRPRHSLLIAVLAAAPVLGAAEPPIAFSGVLTVDGEVRIALTDKETKATTWVEPGDQFNGYTVARYDAKSEAVFLKKDGEETRLGLVPSTTTDSAATASPPALSGMAATPNSAVRANLRRLAAAARHYQIARDVMSVSYSDLVGPGKPIPQLTPVAGEDYSSLMFGPNVTAVSVTTADGNTVTLDVPPQTAAAVATAPIPGTSSATPPSTGAQNPVSPSAAPTPSAAAATAAGDGATDQAANTASTANTTDTANHTAATPPAPNVSPEQPAAPVSPTSPVAENELPPTGRAPAMSYTIQQGDTLRSIAQEHGVTIQQLESLNPRVTNAGSLPEGASIRIR